MKIFDDILFLKQEQIILWGTVIIATLAIYFVLLIIQKFVSHKWQKLAERTAVMWDDLLVDVFSNIKKYFLFGLSIYLSTYLVKFSARPRMLIDKGFMILTFIQIAQSTSIILNFWLTKRLRDKTTGDLAAASTVGLISLLAKFVIYSIILLLALNNLGFDISALIAGLGVGGVAVALAMQNILSDLFSSLSIILDKPFIVGDFIIVDELMGTVEDIGLKTTRVRSISGEQLIFGNGDLLKSRIKNFKRMHQRRIVQSLTVTYQTAPDALEMIPKLIREIIENHDKVTYDRCHFLRFLDSSLEFELVYWVQSADYSEYADRAQSINIAIFKKFNELKIDFAYPTRTLYVTQTPAEA